MLHCIAFSELQRSAIHREESDGWEGIKGRVSAGVRGTLHWSGGTLLQHCTGGTLHWWYTGLLVHCTECTGGAGGGRW